MSIDHISDTARWVAAFRARETERPDALFHDPFARRLAGEKGEALARTLPGGSGMAWTMAVRTRVIDELVARAVATGTDTVLNLACGLDTRPYRLALPSSGFRWIEADLPGILDDKESALGDARPRCVLQRERVDLADDAARQALLTGVGATSKKALVITEGLLLYLPEPAVAQLARELHAQPRFDAWVMDLVGSLALRYVQALWNRQLAAGQARMQFAPPGGVNWFERFGWRVAEHRSFADEGLRLHRGGPSRLWRSLGWLPGSVRERLRADSGLLRLTRA